MIRPRWRKVMRDVRGNKTRTALVVLSIAVGVFAVGTTAGTWVVMSRDLSANYAAITPSSAIVFTAPLDAGAVDAVRSVPGVAAAEGRFDLTVRIQTAPGEWRTMRLEAIEDYSAIQLDKVTPQSGPWPPPAEELLVERASLALTNSDVGDSVELRLPDGSSRDVRIAGLAHDLNKVPASFSGTPFGYITFDTLQWLGYPHAYNALHVLVDGNTADEGHVRSVIDGV